MARSRLFRTSMIELADTLLRHVSNNDIEKAKVLVNLNALLMFIPIKCKTSSKTEQPIYPLELAIKNVNIDMLNMFHKIISMEKNQPLINEYQRTFLNTMPAIDPDGLDDSTYDKLSALKEIKMKAILNMPRARL